MNNTNVITADEGMVFRRISDGVVFGNEISLGYAYYLNGELLETPLLELPEHFEQIPEYEQIVVFDENTELIGFEEGEGGTPDSAPTNPVIESTLQRVTLADYKALEEKVERLLQLVNPDTLPE